MNKAEQLADQCDNFGDGKDQINLSEVARELRRLAPMEAQLNDERELVNRGAALLLNMTDRCDRAYLEKSKLESRVKELEDALRNLMASICGGEKDCGHKFTCICSGDAARKALGLKND